MDISERGHIMIRKYLVIFFISMLPLIELRGAIPYSQFMGLPLGPSYIVAILGNILPVPFIYLFAHKALLWGSNKPIIGPFFSWCNRKGEQGGKKLQQSAGNGLFLALLLFVGIPLPGTGAWTGALAASILKINFKLSILSIIGGIILASIIMSLGSVGQIKIFSYFYLPHGF